MKVEHMRKTVLITGATSGFGNAIAKRFAAEGWKVIATGRRRERLEELVSSLGGTDSVYPLCFDIRDEVATREALGAIPADFQTIDVLVNNAGLALGTGPAQ